MAEIREPEIRLFGTTIRIPTGRVVLLDLEEDSDGDDKPPSNKKACPDPEGTDKEASNSTEKKDVVPNIMTNKAKIESKASSPENSKPGDEPDESNNNPEEKSTKKPDKILPCPRCSSMETKFCYYNNYNVNQPRHFCKNCQRYWTAGGNMRNVPIGAGRRKIKCAGLIQSCRPISIPDFARADSKSVHHLQSLKSDERVLSFGPDAPQSESIASLLNLVEKTMKNSEQMSGDSYPNDAVKEPTNSNCHGFPPNAPYFSGTAWPYPWCPPPLCLPSYSFPFYPMNAYWSLPWLSPQLSTSPNSVSSCSTSNSPISGKHSRDGNLLNHANSYKVDSPSPKKHIWIPKTTRVDDHEKYGECAVLATMEFKDDKADSVNRGEGLFKAFQSTGCHKNHSWEVAQIYLANPAAVSRSLNFQES